MAAKSRRAPSDRYILELLGNRARANDLIRTHALAEVTARLADGLPVIESGRLVMPETLASGQCDLLLRFRLRKGNPEFMWFLIEHKSGPDPATALQVATYRDWIWTRYVRERPRRRILPVIYPILLYNGQRPWTGATCLSDMVSGDVPVPGGGSYCRFQVVDIRRTPVRDLARGAALRAGLFTAGLAGESPRDPRSLLPALKMLERVHASSVTRPALTFIMRAFEIDSATLRDLAQEAGLSRLEGRMQTIYEQLETRGIARGLARGRTEGKAETLLLLLRERFRRVPASVKKRVLAATPGQLDDWLRAVLTADSLDDIFGAPAAH